MADYTKFTSVVYTRASYDEAVALADADTREQAINAFGNANYTTGGATELKVKFNDNGTYTATSVLFAAPADPAPEISALEDPELPQPEETVITPQVDAPAEVDFFQTEGEAPPLPQQQQPVDPTTLEGYGVNETGATPIAIDGVGVNETGASEAATKIRAQEQQTLGARLKTPTNGDWRFRISIAENSDYLYNDTAVDGGISSILAPLKATNGVIFPYTPIVETNYRAVYEQADLTHSNYRGYFYKNSYVDAVSIRGTFTAQDTKEANYLLAVIHFFRSVTKMFYGQDPAYRGSPPPLIFLNGFGQYQFKNHPGLISNFTYSLPNDVDYIRVDPNNYGLNMLAQKTPAFTGAGNLLASIKARLTSAGGIPLGGIFQPPVQSTVNQTVNTVGEATYVPTKMEISVTVLPVQSRRQVSQQFSFKDFANGNQLKGGFW